jgi:hypothetical protein
VELDGGSISHEELEARRRRTEGVVIGGSGVLRSPDDEADAEFLGEGENKGREIREVCPFLSFSSHVIRKNKNKNKKKKEDEECV